MGTYDSVFGFSQRNTANLDLFFFHTKATAKFHCFCLKSTYTMPGDVDKSLLERLQALRGSSSSASSQAAPITYEKIF